MRVLVATDIAARGIHIDDVALVVHVDPPAEHKAYLHRSGRTARAGAAGVVVTPIGTPDQSKAVRLLARDAKVTPTTTKVTPGHALVRQLVGPAAPTVPVSATPRSPKPVATSTRHMRPTRRTPRQRSKRTYS